MPRYVVLQHEPSDPRGKPLHWDFMLEADDGLRTWSLSHEPAPDCLIAAEQLADHRREYLEYEGPISENRGTVRRWDSGEYRVLEEEDDRIRLSLAGIKLHGEVTLSRPAERAQRWSFAFLAKPAPDR